MKKILSLLVALFAAITITGCSENNSTPSSKKSNSITTSTTSSDIYKPFVLTDNNISPSSFIINGTSLLFCNWEDNNKISIINEPYPINSISSKDVVDFFNYSASTLTLINNTLYFGDDSNSSNLASLNIADKTYTKLNSKHVHEISSLNNQYIFYLDIPNEDSNIRKLYRYDIDEKKDTQLTSDNVGKYIINNDFIIYQNLSDSSRLYKISIDGTAREQLTDYSVNSFTVYSNQLLTVNSDDNNSLYILDPSTLDSKRIGLLNISDLKSFNNKLYCLDSSNKLNALTVTAESSDSNLSTITSDSINEYYLTEKGIFLQKSINVNNPYIINFQAE